MTYGDTICMTKPIRSCAPDGPYLRRWKHRSKMLQELISDWLESFGSGTYQAKSGACCSLSQNTAWYNVSLRKISLQHGTNLAVVAIDCESCGL